MKGGKSIYKYSKVTQQKKFHLLTLVLHQKLLIKQAARIVGINYSTAKTIMFFNRNHNMSYLFSFQNPHHVHQQSHSLQASYRQLPCADSQDLTQLASAPRVAIFNSIGSQRMACRSLVHRKTTSGNFTKRIKEDSNDLSQEYVDEQKHIESLKLERPRTRSQLALFNSYCNSKTEDHLKRDFESSGLPEVEHK